MTSSSNPATMNTHPSVSADNPSRLSSSSATTSASPLPPSSSSSSYSSSSSSTSSTSSTSSSTPNLLPSSMSVPSTSVNPPRSTLHQQQQFQSSSSSYYPSASTSASNPPLSAPLSSSSSYGISGFGVGEIDAFLGEFSVVTDFLQNLESTPPSSAPDTPYSTLSFPLSLQQQQQQQQHAYSHLDPIQHHAQQQQHQQQQQPLNGQGSGGSSPVQTSLSSTPAASSASSSNPSTITPTERFLLRAADPAEGTAEDRLSEIINAKYEAGMLKPHNYANGYARFQRFIELNLNPGNRQRILSVMGTFRPAFRKVAQSLTDFDLLLVEESFERLLYDYDRVFNSVGMPACLWRRTAEICKVNQEFANLVDIPFEKFYSPESPVCLYELMSEDSIVNYWEKYGNVAFDSGQKAVLTSCVLKTPKGKLLPCCLSFTIRRDKYNLPYCIVGNFLPM